MIVNPTSSQTSMVRTHACTWSYQDSLGSPWAQSKDNANAHNEQSPPHAPPPSYEAVVGNGGHSAYITSRQVLILPHPTLLSTVSGQYLPDSATKGQDVKVPTFPSSSPYQVAGPSLQAGQPATVVYNYVNPLTGERVVSLLPPDHPQMLCLQQGGHVTTTKFGILGESHACPCMLRRKTVLTAGCACSQVFWLRSCGSPWASDCAC